MRQFLTMRSSGVATGGGKRGDLPPPNLRLDTPWDRCRSEIFVFEKKNGSRFTGFAPKFYMHRRYGGRSLVLRLRKRGSCGSCWRSYLVGRRWSCGTLLDPWHWPSKYNIFILFLFLFLFLNVNLGPILKKWLTKSDEFSVFDRG